MTKRNFFIYFIAVFLWGCSTSSPTVNNYDYTYLYDNDQKIINPKFKLFHHSVDSSTLFFEIMSDDILYSRMNDSISVANVWVKYKLLAKATPSAIIDSSTVPLVNYGKNGSTNVLRSSIQLKVPNSQEYNLEVRFRDANKDLNVIHNLGVDKRNNYNNQFFLLSQNGVTILDEVVSFKEDLLLTKSPIVEENSFLLEGAIAKFSMTPPPFIESMKDKIEVIDESSNEIKFEDNQLIISNFKSINWLRNLNDTSTQFCYFYHFYDGYPEITQLTQMTEPIRYISTSSEYKTIKAAVNVKKALDAFWLKLGKEEERAKFMIKEYYGRIENANLHFSTYKEGWKTDRGIIHIIYGKPNTIYKTKNKETWIYGEESNILSTKFEFFRRNNNITGNDFELLRNPEYKSNWYRSVDLWRQAKIY